MITLHVYGPDLGLPDPSPFVAKGHMLLKLAGLPYEARRSDPRKAPKHKLPVIEDDGQIVPDSTFIRLHIEKKYGFDFDAGLSQEQKGIAWAAEKMCEDHLYWIAMYERWVDDENFQAGPARFFNVIPQPVRPIVRSMVRKQIRDSLRAHGMGRHSREEMAVLGERAIGSIAAIMGGKPYFMGDRPCGADATVYAFLSSGACPVFRSHLRDAIAAHDKLSAYVDRMTAQYFPELVGKG
jgi:glutathione S-transferase